MLGSAAAAAEAAARRRPKQQGWPAGLHTGRQSASSPGGCWPWLPGIQAAAASGPSITWHIRYYGTLGALLRSWPGPGWPGSGCLNLRCPARPPLMRAFQEGLAGFASGTNMRGERGGFLRQTFLQQRTFCPHPLS